MEQYAIGWDVGGWNCDNNQKSRDAIAILDPCGDLVGKIWRGNLSRSILDAPDADAWIAALFALCESEPSRHVPSATVGIDTPLGFSDSFRALLLGAAVEEVDPVSSQNPYLYRQTERLLAEEGLLGKGRAPLSPLKDMIGSQATKGMHVVAKFCPRRASCGVWSGERLTAIETYPTVSRDCEHVRRIVESAPQPSSDDRQDALVCAAVARLFVTNRRSLVPPRSDTPENEGWIWRPAPSV